MAYHLATGLADEINDDFGKLLTNREKWLEVLHGARREDLLTFIELIVLFDTQLCIWISAPDKDNHEQVPVQTLSVSDGPKDQ